MNEMKHIKVKTIWGVFCLHVSRKNIEEFIFPKKCQCRDSSRGFRSFKRKLEAYFSGSKISLKDLPVNLSRYSRFQKKILSALRNVPPGKRISYGDLARKAGFKKAGRAVGNVMNQNDIPVIIPCHRVIRSNGSLGGYGPGKIWKERLLDLEEE